MNLNDRKLVSQPNLLPCLSAIFPICLYAPIELRMSPNFKLILEGR